MSTGLEQVVQTGDWDRRTVSENGQVTIPAQLREKYDINPEDDVVVGETIDGTLCIVKPGE